MEAQKNPKVTSFLSVGPLPEGIKSLLHVVAEGEWRDAKTEHVYRQHSPEAVRDACAAFLAVVLFGKKTDAFRVLGLPANAPLSDVRDHKRLLLKWLHPDRNEKLDEREYLARVIEATEAIEDGRSHSFGDAAQKTVTLATSPTPRVRAPGADTAQSVERMSAVWRGARQSASRLAAHLMRGAKLSAVALAIVLCSLLAWRHVMDEPIGSSVERYAKLAAGLVGWP